MTKTGARESQPNRIAAAYVRISRDREGAGLGVDRQEADCRALAEKLGLTLGVVYRDNDLSAYSGKPRPGYLALLDEIRAGRVAAVLAWHTDRLHRSPTELETYISASEIHGTPTYTVKAGIIDLSTPSGKMVARTLGVFARYEVDHMIERQKRAKVEAAADGKWRGGRRPYGYAADGVTVIESEAAELRAATQAILTGSSVRSVALALNARGATTSTGGSWEPDSIRRVLMRPRNAGLVDHDGEIVSKALWPAIVPEDDWRAVVAILGDPARRTQISSARRWMGSGLYRCHCGAFVRATASGTGRSGAHSAYVCTSGVKHLTRIVHGVDDLVSDLVIDWLTRPEAQALLAADGPTDTTLLHVEAMGIRVRLDELAALFAVGDLSASQLRTASELMRRRLEVLERQIADASRTSVLSGLVGLKDTAAVWNEVDLDRRRAIISRLFTVTLLPSAKGRRPGWKPGQSYFDPATVQIDWKI